MDFCETESSAAADAAQLNVNGSDDPHYRYKMPSLEVTILSKFGGTTSVTNADTVASAIYRELSDLSSCFSKSLGTRAKVQKSDGTIEIPGKHDVQVLQEHLQKYILTNVLCQKCGSPETLSHKKKRKCQACGALAP